MTVRTLTAAAVLLVVTPLSAQTERDLDAHEHGEATLDVSIDGNELAVDFASPWNNLVGFEHAPSSDEEHAAIEDARSRLENPDNIVRLAAVADCTLGGRTVEDTMAEGHDDHDDEHAHDGDATHGHDEAEGGTHSEIRVGYVFTCGDISALDGLDVTIGDTWSTGFEEVDVRLIGPGGQSATELDGGTGRIDLAPVS